MHFITTLTTVAVVDDVIGVVGERMTPRSSAVLVA